MMDGRDGWSNGLLDARYYKSVSDKRSKGQDRGN